MRNIAAVLTANRSPARFAPTPIFEMLIWGFRLSSLMSEPLSSTYHLKSLLKRPRLLLVLLCNKKWGGQSWPQPPFRRLVGLYHGYSWASATKPAVTGLFSM